MKRSALDPISPLDGIIIADFSRILAGPLATMTLADLGALVIKVERPGSGDDTRNWGPPYSSTGTTYFESVNRNKKSICMDLTNPGDLEQAQSLAYKADVVVENFKPGSMEKLGLDYETLKTVNPGVIYVSITGFGGTGGTGGPSLLGYDFIAQALGGLMSITGDADGGPMKVGVALVDVLTAKDATIGILAALHERSRTGLGSRIEVNLLSSLQGALANQGQAYLGAGAAPSRMGNDHPSIAPYQLLSCEDGPLAVACGNDGQFVKMAEVLESPELATDDRFATNSSRVRNRVELVRQLEKKLSAAPAKVWQSKLTSAGVPSGQIATIADGLDFAASIGLEPTIDVEDASGTYLGKQVRHPITWTPPLVKRNSAPPNLDEHGSEVRAWLTEQA